MINCAVLVAGGDTTEGKEFFRNVINDAGGKFTVFDQTKLLQDQEAGHRSRFQQDGLRPSTQLSVIAQNMCFELVERMCRWAMEGAEVALSTFAVADGEQVGLATVPVSRCPQGWHRSSTIAYMFAEVMNSTRGIAGNRRWNVKFLSITGRSKHDVRTIVNNCIEWAAKPWAREAHVDLTNRSSMYAFRACSDSPVAYRNWMTCYHYMVQLSSWWLQFVEVLEHWVGDVGDSL